MSAQMIYEQALNGVPVTLADLPKLATLNTGHFTAMQVRAGKVKGWQLHLARLEASSMTLFGCTVPVEKLLFYISTSVGGSSCSLRVHIFPAAANPAAITPDDLQVLVIRSAPVEMNTHPIAVGIAEYERVLPHIKHAGISIGLQYYKRQALLNGYDDVLYTTATGHISEGSIWNIGFYDGSRFVFPAAPALPGIMLQLIMTGLERLNIPWTTAWVDTRQLPAFTAAFAMNSITAAQPIRQIEAVVFPGEATVFKMLQDAYDQIPWEELLP
jgi:4-amino-4-deoxychorismate lyase